MESGGGGNGPSFHRKNVALKLAEKSREFQLPVICGLDRHSALSQGQIHIHLDFLHLLYISLQKSLQILLFCIFKASLHAVV